MASAPFSPRPRASLRRFVPDRDMCYLRVKTPAFETPAWPPGVSARKARPRQDLIILTTHHIEVNLAASSVSTMHGQPYWFQPRLRTCRRYIGRFRWAPARTPPRFRRVVFGHIGLPLRTSQIGLSPMRVIADAYAHPKSALSKIRTCRQRQSRLGRLC